MNIYRYVQDKLSSERGSTAVMAAILLPLMLAFSGMAVDVGNLYSHHANLQNAADSAAKAGGTAFKNNNETANEHPIADEEAQKYGKISYGGQKNNYAPETLRVECEGRVKNEGQPDEYNVLKITAYETVPFHFLKFFCDPITISATSYCMIVPEDGDAEIPGTEGTPGVAGKPGSKIFDNLFTFDYYVNPWWSGGNFAFNSVNNVQNPDNPNLQQNIASCSTYDGPVMAASQQAYDSATADQNLRHNVMLTEEAFANGHLPTVNEAISKGYTTDIEYTGDIDITEFYREVVSKMETADSTFKLLDQNVDNDTRSKYKNLDSDKLNDLSKKGVDAIYYNFNNLDIDFSKKIEGDTSKPLYLICDTINNFNFSADMNGGRQIVLVYTGTDQLTINGSGGTFNGIIYAPYGKVFVNDNGLHLNGSVACRGLQLQSNGYYKHDGVLEATPGTPGTEGTHGTPGTPASGGSHKVIMGGADDW